MPGKKYRFIFFLGDLCSKVKTPSLSTDPFTLVKLRTRSSGQFIYLAQKTLWWRLLREANTFILWIIYKLALSLTDMARLNLEVQDTHMPLTRSKPKKPVFQFWPAHEEIYNVINGPCHCGTMVLLSNCALKIKNPLHWQIIPGPTIEVNFTTSIPHVCLH